ncbi:MAG: hydroxyproline-2-epimerase [Verrucomicrobiaceae bacterium]|nr:MAG: hydroxyproline-2-epimerase [Verrucomicrobiaceae bacterium]
MAVKASDIIRVIDSHTGGEPTRVVISGVPDLGTGPLSERAELFSREHDWLRGAVANEPRGHEAMVGALLVEPHAPGCVCGVIFFNNVGTLNMCIHGTIGLAATLLHMGRIGPGLHRIDTPVGVVTIRLNGDDRVTVTNVPCHRKAADVSVDVPEWGTVTGDIAWGGNWFFLIDGQGPPVDPAHLDELTRFTRMVKRSLEQAGISGDDGMPIDHIETFFPPTDPATADSRNFVLCPGDAYDRSPCGTGTSAKLACLHAAGKLKPGQIWRQAGILGTVFEGTVTENADGTVIPSITGSAWITGESSYHFAPDDPFRFGIPSTRPNN